MFRWEHQTRKIYLFFVSFLGDMSRTYVKKKATVVYDKEYLQSALKDAGNGRIIRAAAKQYGLSFETVRRWVYKLSTYKGTELSTVLTPDGKHCIVIALKYGDRLWLPI